MCGWAQILCDGKLPFVGLTEKVEQELIWKVRPRLLWIFSGLSGSMFFEMQMHLYDVYYCNIL